MPSRQKHQDISQWGPVNTFTVEQAVCLWAGIDPAIAASDRSNLQKSLLAPIYQLLWAAIQDGSLSTDSSRNLFAGQGQHLPSLVTRKNLKLFAESIGEQPAFLFNAVESKAGVVGSTDIKSKAGRPSSCEKEVWLERLIILSLNNKINVEDSQDAIAQALVDDLKKLNIPVSVNTVKRDWIGPIIRKARGEIE